MTRSTPAWYERWFNEDYQRVYQHRDEAAAKQEVEFAIQQLNLQPEEHIYDSCCGDGRHLVHLLRRGYNRACGSDLSAEQLATARRRCRQAVGTAPLVRADMRTPVTAGMDAVLNFFTSFGYFSEEQENQQTLQALHDCLRKEGRFLLDLANKPFVLAHVEPRTERTVDGHPVIEERRFDERTQRIEKRITIHRDAETVVHHESVRLYELNELQPMLTRAGLAIDHCHGDFTAQACSPSTPRLIVIGHACR